MNKTTLSALLGRPLTSIEDTNFSLYLNIANQSLDELICAGLCDTDETRTYDAREGYRTIFTDIFTDVTSVTKNGEAVATTDYSIRQWDKRSASWYNSIVFTDALEAYDEIAVTADWGFGGSMPKDLQLVLAQLFGLITKKNKFDATVSSKQVEDFRISFNADADLDEAFYKNYNSILKKYSMCSLPTLRQGEAHGTWV